MSNKNLYPTAITLDWCNESFENGRAVYDAISLAGGFGSSREAAPPALDASGLDGDYKLAVEAVLQNAAKKKTEK